VFLQKKYKQNNFSNKTFSIQVFKQCIVLRMSSVEMHRRATGNSVDYLGGRSGPQRGVQVGGTVSLSKIMQLKNKPTAKNYTNGLLCTTYKERPRVMMVVSARTRDVSARKLPDGLGWRLMRTLCHWRQVTVHTHPYFFISRSRRQWRYWWPCQPTANIRLLSCMIMGLFGRFGGACCLHPQH